MLWGAFCELSAHDSCMICHAFGSVDLDIGDSVDGSSQKVRQLGKKFAVGFPQLLQSLCACRVIPEQNIDLVYHCCPSPVRWQSHGLFFCTDATMFV